MISKRARNIIQCAQLQLQAGNEWRASQYYAEAARLISAERKRTQARWEARKARLDAKTTRDIEGILGAGYVTTILW